MAIGGHISADLGVKDHQALDHEELGFHAANGCSARQDLHMRISGAGPPAVRLPRPPPRSPAWHAQLMVSKMTVWRRAGLQRPLVPLLCVWPLVCTEPTAIMLPRLPFTMPGCMRCHRKQSSIFYMICLEASNQNEYQDLMQMGLGRVAVKGL